MTEPWRRKDADHVGSPLDLLVQPFEWIRTVQLPLVLERPQREREVHIALRHTLHDSVNAA